MNDFYFSANISNSRTLCLAPLTDRHISLTEDSIGDASGYYLFETQETEGLETVEVIAHVVSDDAALKLRDLLDLE